MAKEKTQISAEEGLFESILEKFQRNRKYILLGLITVVLIFVVFFISVSVRDRLHTQRLVQIDAFESRFFELQSIDEFAVIDEEESIARMTEIIVLLDELTAFQRRAFGFSKARAYTLSGEIYWFLDDKSQAEAEWLEAAKAAKNSYLEPVSFFNAAVAAEEQGNLEAAIKHFTSALNVSDNFPAAARAQFAIGRIEESRNNIDAALTAYRNILGRWPQDQLWANLAQSRIIAISN